MSEENLEIDTLLQWATANNTSLHPNVEIYQDAITGLSFRATGDIKSGSDIVSCSYGTTLSFLNSVELSSKFDCHGSQLLPSGFIDALSPEDPHVIGHFFLMQQYLMGKDSFWWNYIKLLPQPDQPEKLALPIWWPDADRNFLAGTNAEPPLEKRQALWEDEWSRGIALLRQQSDHWEDYNYLLYQWAASIFGTRSFRASLTIPEEILDQAQHGPSNRNIILDHVRKDVFSVLLPVLDIGNHNGLNQVVWTKDPIAGSFGLCTTEPLTQGSQIFNYYGNKSNSELLVGYGFILPGTENDTVNLKLTPPAEAAQLRKAQKSYALPTQTGEDFMFKIWRPSKVARVDGGLVEFEFFSVGLFDTLACMVANKREIRFINNNPGYCMEQDPSVLAGPLARAFLLTLRVLFDKIDHDFDRIRISGVNLNEPRNSNQVMALDYRNRQLDVLKGALTSIQKRLQTASSFSSFCQHPHHNIQPTYIEGYLRQMHTSIELLSLECAFDWLRSNYLDIYDAVVQIISDDQEEPLPLDWAVLVEDWDHTYWVIWIYLVWMLWAKNGKIFQSNHPNLSSWLVEMNAAYQNEISSLKPTGIFYAEPSEQDTINHTVQEITKLPQFATVREWLQDEKFSWEALRNFASYLAQQETIPVGFNMKSVAGAAVEHKMLAVTKEKEPLVLLLDTPWTQFFGRSPGFKET